MTLALQDRKDVLGCTCLICTCQRRLRQRRTDKELTSQAASHVLVLLEGALHVVPLISWYQAEALVERPHRPTATWEEHLGGTRSHVSNLLFGSFLGLLFHSFHLCCRMRSR